MHINEILKTVGIENAKEWAILEDKYVYCIDLLEMSADQGNADHMVELMESHFEKLLNNE